MYGYIDGYDFGEMEAMKYWAPPSSKIIVARPANAPCGFTTTFCEQKRRFAQRLTKQFKRAVCGATRSTPRQLFEKSWIKTFL